MKKKVAINADRAIGASAILISLLTLFIFLYQTHLLKEQSRLSVRPRLSFSKNITQSMTVNDLDSIQSTLINISLTLRNDGLGPAIIESNHIVDRGNPYDILTFFDTVYPKLREYGVFTQITELKIGEALPASKTVAIFTYQYRRIDEDKINNYLNISESYELPFDVLIEYASLYEEKWMIRSNSKGHPTKLD
ncbi:hypothetical protein [Ulvibacterium sp.]|uniref:hypothetical protein n=1 Tax=Ulvibacterium sp. TaxID=2665914 RepID=UPI0026246347|nr:hypothetical protein [Ulvibacterium sp.]